MTEANTALHTRNWLRDAWGHLQKQLALFRRPENRRMTLALITGAAFLAVVTVTWLWWQDRDYRPLYGRQEQYDAGVVIEQLDKAGVAYRVHPDTGQVMVRTADLPEARMALATGGIMPSLPEGRSLLNEAPPLGISHFMERQRYIASLEGELARTVMTLQQIRFARVHLAIPEQTVFLRQSREPRASVAIELNAGARLSPAHIEGIVNLVAGSVADLDRKNVNVVDQMGAPLSDELDETAFFRGARRQLEYQSAIERRLEGRVLDLLTPLAGYGNVRVQVAAELDTSTVEQTRDVYSPGNESVRSESMQQLSSGDALPGGTPGALDTAENNALQTTQEKQYVRNYEVDRTVSREQRQAGDIRRLTVAVLLNTRQGAEGGQAWSDDDVSRLTGLVKQAVGFSEDRGDQISVDSLPFLVTPPAFPDGAPWWKHPTLIEWGGRLLLTLIIVCLLWLGVRLLIRRWFSARTPQAPEPARSSAIPGSGLSGVERKEVPDERSYREDAEGFQTRVDELKQLARREPGKVAHVLRQWLSENRIS